MMLPLVRNVFLDSLDVGVAHRERAVAGLPGEAAEAWNRLVDPSRGTPLISRTIADTEDSRPSEISK